MCGTLLNDVGSQGGPEICMMWHTIHRWDTLQVGCLVVARMEINASFCCSFLVADGATAVFGMIFVCVEFVMLRLSQGNRTIFLVFFLCFKICSWKAKEMSRRRSWSSGYMHSCVQCRVVCSCDGETPVWRTCDTHTPNKCASRANKRGRQALDFSRFWLKTNVKTCINANVSGVYV